MVDPTFETLLTRELRAYAEAGVRPSNRFAIAETTIARGRAMPRWRLAPMGGRRVFVPLLVGLLLAALAAGALLVGSRQPAPTGPLHTYVNELVSAPDLSLPMAHPALVPLLDGRVLVIGDDGDGGGTGTRALIYDPAAGVSQPAGPVVSADTMSVESALRLKDGRVLVIGSDFDGKEIAQVFDPGTRRFTPAGPMVAPRTGAAIALLPDGHVLIAGGIPSGQDGATSSAELFDPDSSAFSTAASLGTSHAYPAAATLLDGRVFVTPGLSRLTAEVYDPGTGAFSVAGTRSSYSAGDIAIALRDGRVVVFGHFSMPSQPQTAEVWDPTSLTFSPGRDLPHRATGATLLDDGRVLLVGGDDATWSGIYDPTTSETLSTGSPRAWWPSETRLADGRVLIVGGLTDGEIRPGPDGGGISAPGVSTVEVFQ